MLLVGAGVRAARIENEIADRPDDGIQIVGVVDETLDPAQDIEEKPWCGRGCGCSALRAPLSRLGELVQRTKPDRIVLALRDRRGRLPVDELLAACRRGILVQDGSEFYASLTGKMPLEWLSPAGLTMGGQVRRTRLRERVDAFVSFLVGVAGAFLFAPIMLVVAAAIRLDSDGPILFVQDRIGLDGEPFRLFKFRTMRVVDENKTEWAVDNEDRITRVGRVLRRFRLDELPQLANLVLGDMNLVGPRPHPVAHYDLLVRSIPFYELRTAVRPGITGWAQVKYGYANNLEEEIEKMRYDLYYVKRGDLALDLQIVLETIRTVFAGSEVTAGRAEPETLELDPVPAPMLPAALAAASSLIPFAPQPAVAVGTAAGVDLDVLTPADLPFLQAPFRGTDGRELGS